MYVSYDGMGTIPPVGTIHHDLMDFTYLFNDNQFVDNMHGCFWFQGRFILGHHHPYFLVVSMRGEQTQWSR